MEWFEYYRIHKNDGTINEVVQAYNIYIFQNQSPQVLEDTMKRLGTNAILLQENSYALVQEGVNTYGLLQEIGNDKNLR